MSTTTNGTNGNYSTAAAPSREVSPNTGVEASWVDHCGKLQQDEKQRLGGYVASHHIRFGARILIGSGTTLNTLMDQIIDHVRLEAKPYDLNITSTNMHVIERGSDAMSSDVALFHNMQLSLVGGRLQMGLRSLVGEFAVAGVESRLFYPDLVIFGAVGLYVGPENLDITYQFEEELPVQRSFGRRPTDHRILLLDHSKIGRRGGWRADLGVESLLCDARECSLITTLPPAGHERRPVVLQQVEAFRALLERMAPKPEFQGKELRLVVLDLASKEEIVHSLSAARMALATNEPRERKRNGSARLSPHHSRTMPAATVRS